MTVETGASGAERPVFQDAAELAGVSDGYERLWTPHRLVYLREGQQPSRELCPFCRAPEMSDEEGLIVFRGEAGYALLNLYPYNTGHLLICPYEHVATYDRINREQIGEIGALTQQAMRVLKKVLGCDGFNIGMNQGQVAGAGIAGHLHQHIVPRWALDANFFPIIARTKALPQLLGSVRQRLAASWQENSTPSS